MFNFVNGFYHEANDSIEFSVESPTVNDQQIDHILFAEFVNYISVKVLNDRFLLMKLFRTGIRDRYISAVRTISIM